MNIKYVAMHSVFPVFFRPIKEFKEFTLERNRTDVKYAANHSVLPVTFRFTIGPIAERDHTYVKYVQKHSFAPVLSGCI